MIRLLVFSVALGQIHAQLHVISGNPNPKGDSAYAIDLLRITAGGALEQVQSLTTPGIGTEWLDVSHDWGKAVLLSKNPTRVVVVDFEKAAIVKSCPVPPIDGMRSPITEWLAAIPGLGPTLQQHLAGEDINRDVVQGMVLDPAVTCAKSFTTSEPNNLTYFQVETNALVMSTANDGTLTRWLGRKPITLEFTIPAALLQGIDMHDSASAIEVNNSQILAVSVLQGFTNARTFVFRKRDKSWRQLPIPADTGRLMRAFGRYIAIVEYHRRQSDGDKSPGMREWRRQEARRGPALTERSGPLALPTEMYTVTGRLHLYDSDSERMYTITTNQADSEIILVQDNTVYYRSSDRLYSAPLGARGIGKPQLLVKDEAIRDAHWAFKKGIQQ